MGRTRALTSVFERQDLEKDDGDRKRKGDDPNQASGKSGSVFSSGGLTAQTFTSRICGAHRSVAACIINQSRHPHQAATLNLC